MAETEEKEKSRYKPTFTRAIDGIRTRDPDLGKVVLYQLSHYRIYVLFAFRTIYTIHYGKVYVNCFLKKYKKIL